MLLTGKGEVHVTLVRRGSLESGMRTAFSDCRLPRKAIDRHSEIRLPTGIAVLGELTGTKDVVSP
jgi:hypothetical protein